MVFDGAEFKFTIPNTETSFFTCFGVDTASPLVEEWLGSKVGLVKNRKFLSPNFKLLKVTFCPQIYFINSIYHVFRLLVEGDYARAACLMLGGSFCEKV